MSEESSTETFEQPEAPATIEPTENVTSVDEDSAAQDQPETSTTETTSDEPTAEAEEESPSGTESKSSATPPVITKKRTHDQFEASYQPDEELTAAWTDPWAAYAKQMAAAQLAANAQAAQNSPGGHGHTGAASGSQAPPGVPVCNDYLRGVCHRLVCKYWHPPGAGGSQSSGGSSGGSSTGGGSTSTTSSGATLIGGQQVCRDFLKGQCHRAQCKFPHVSPSPSNPVTVQPRSAPTAMPPYPAPPAAYGGYPPYGGYGGYPPYPDPWAGYYHAPPPMPGYGYDYGAYPGYDYHGYGGSSGSGDSESK